MHSPRIGPNLAGELLSELLSYSVVLWVRTGNDSREDWTKFCRAGGSPKFGPILLIAWGLEPTDKEKSIHSPRIEPNSAGELLSEILVGRDR